MKYFLMFVCFFSAAASADIYLNGSKLDVLDIYITTDEAETPPVTPPVEPPVTPPAPPTSCDSVDAYTMLDEQDWTNQGSQEVVPLDKTIISVTPFTTTSGDQYLGQISVASTTGNSNVSRRIWISECPAGPRYSKPQCERTGSSSTVVKWKQNSDVNSRCDLKPNTRYYINHQNLNCPQSSCDVYRNLYNNRKPT